MTFQSSFVPSGFNFESPFVFGQSQLQTQAQSQQQAQAVDRSQGQQRMEQGQIGGSPGLAGWGEELGRKIKPET
jgi:hypothetical protein